MIAISLIMSLLSSQQAIDTSYQIDVEQIDGEFWCSVSAEHAPLNDLLQDLAIKLGITVEGMSSRPSPTVVTVNLRHRTATEAIEFILGSVGLAGDLRTGALTLRKLVPTNANSDELRQYAMVSYLRTAKSFPEHAIGPEIELGQARVEEGRGNLEAAKDHLVSLIDRFPQSDLVPKALFNAGRLFMSIGAWDKAEILFSQLLRREIDPALERTARFMIAQCAAFLKDSRRSLLSINALDNLYPPADAKEFQRRMYLRARALIGLDREREALEVLDEADGYGLDRSSRRVSLELRAKALEASSSPGDAARVWLAYSEAAPEGETSAALQDACRLALLAGDEVGVLFIYEHADEDVAPRLEPYVHEARVRLGLDSRWSGTSGSNQRLSRAERLLEAGMTSEAHTLLQTLYLSRLLVNEEQRLRIYLAYARTLEAEKNLDMAIDMLRESIESLSNADHRREVYLLAAKLYEEHQRFDEAVEAYRGRLGGTDR